MHPQKAIIIFLSFLFLSFIFVSFDALAISVEQEDRIENVTLKGIVKKERQFFFFKYLVLTNIEPQTVFHDAGVLGRHHEEITIPSPLKLSVKPDSSEHRHLMNNLGKKVKMSGYLVDDDAYDEDIKYDRFVVEKVYLTPDDIHTNIHQVHDDIANQFKDTTDEHDEIHRKIEDEHDQLMDQADFPKDLF